MSKFQGSASLQPCTSLLRSRLLCLSTMRCIYLPTTPMLNNLKSQECLYEFVWFLINMGYVTQHVLKHNGHQVNDEMLVSVTVCLTGMV